MKSIFLSGVTLAMLMAAHLGMLTAAHAAPIDLDLGLGLVYHRAHVLPADLPMNESVRQHPCVLDLRFAQGDAQGGARLLAWLKLHASLKTPVFLLANAETSPVLLMPLNSPDAVIGLIILGPEAPNFTPDIALRVSAAVDRRAYTALEKGAPVQSLIVEKLDKPRVDEEMLAREHLSDSAVRDDDADAPAAKTAPAPPAQLIDAVLQRAVQLDRTLLALKRI